MNAIIQIRSLNPTYCYNCEHFEMRLVLSPLPHSRCWYKASIVSGAPVSAEHERASDDPFDCGQEARFFQPKKPAKNGLLRKVFNWVKP